MPPTWPTPGRHFSSTPIIPTAILAPGYSCCTARPRHRSVATRSWWTALQWLKGFETRHVPASPPTQTLSLSLALLLSCSHLASTSISIYSMVLCHELR